MYRRSSASEVCSIGGSLPVIWEKGIEFHDLFISVTLIDRTIILAINRGYNHTGLIG